MDFYQEPILRDYEELNGEWGIEDSELFSYYTGNEVGIPSKSNSETRLAIYMGCFNNVKFAMYVIRSQIRDDYSFCAIACSSLLFNGYYAEDIVKRFRPSVLYYPGRLDDDFYLRILSIKNMEYAVAQAAIIFNDIELYSKCNVHCEMGLLESSIVYQRRYFYDDLCRKGRESGIIYKVINSDFTIRHNTETDKYVKIDFYTKLDSRYIFNAVPFTGNIEHIHYLYCNILGDTNFEEDIIEDISNMDIN